MCKSMSRSEKEQKMRWIGYQVERYKIVAAMLSGPFAGAAFFLLLREGLSRFLTEYYLIPLGIIFVLTVIFIPQGFLGFWRRELNGEEIGGELAGVEGWLLFLCVIMTVLTPFGSTMLLLIALLTK